MSQQQLSTFVSPVTQPLDTMHTHLSNLSTAYRDVNTKLSSHLDTLLAGTQGFQGSGANTFSSLIDYYTGAVEKHCQALDTGANTAKSCSMQVKNAVDTAASSRLDASIVTHVLGQLTLDDIIRQGGSAIDPIMQDMQNTCNQMQNTWNNLQKTWANEDKTQNDVNAANSQSLTDLFSLNFGGWWNDQVRIWNDTTHQFSNYWQEGSDYLQLGGQGLHLLWDAIQLAWQTLKQWAEDIFQAVKNCLSTISSIVTTATQDINTFISGIVKDEQRLVDDVQKGDYTAAINEILNDFVNPELKMMGMQPLSQSQIQEMLPPSFWQWFKNLPTWAKILLIVVVVAIIVWMLIWGAATGKKTDQQKRIDRIRDALSGQSITVTNAQIEALIKAGYSDPQIIYILKTAGLDQSGKMYITDRNGNKVYGHTLDKHVNIDNTDLKKRTEARQRLTTTFKNQTTAQNAVNYAIANSATLQNFIDHGAANSTVTDTVCYHSKPLPNLGYGYDYRRVPPPPKAVKIGPLHCMHVTLARTILGIIFVLTAYPVSG